MQALPIPWLDAFLLAILPVAALAIALVMLRRRRVALARTNARLASERDRVRLALEGSSISLWDWDIAADSVWLDASWKEMLGALPGETRMPIAGLAESVHPDDLASVREAASGSLKGESDWFDAEFRIRGLDGVLRWIRCRGKVTDRDPEGRALRAAGTSVDITSRKRAEKSLAESEARFRALTELSSDLYWEQDEHFNLVSWSAPAWASMRDPRLPRPQLEAPELTEADWASHRAVLEERRAFRDLEIRQVSADGREAWLSAGAVPIVDDKGAFRGYRGLAKVITDRKRAEKLLQESESQLRQLVEFMPAAIAFVDPGHRVVVHNKAFASLLGVPEGGIDEQDIGDVLGKGRFGEIEPLLIRALDGEGAQQALRGPGPGGRIVDLDVRHWPLRNADGRVEGVIVLAIDVTDLKEADRLKDHFLSVVSHELRTPLTSMRGSLGLLSGGVAGELPAEAKSLVEIALQNSDRLWRLVNDLLDIEKMAAGHARFRVEPLDWRAALREAVDASRGLMQQFDITLELEPGEDTRVAGDADRLSQVLANLILNAVKFSPKGGVVSVGARRRPGGLVRTSVRDRGPGIPESFRSRIFQPFAQADSADSRATGGTGLGLAICREIVARLGGEIGFEDAPGGGTIFWFDLPEGPVAQ